MKQSEKHNLGAYLSPLAVVALSFGYAVGWGSFVMPGTTFLPDAGPVGTIVGILLGAAAMAVFAFNYHRMLLRVPGPGGAYAFATKAFGSDHGFLLGWFLWPNGQCAILCVLSVIALTAVCVRFPGKPLPMLCAGLICFGMLYSLGTRISFAAIPAIGAALFICLLLSDRRLFPSALSVLLIALLFTALYPLSPMAKSQELTAQNAAVKQERIAAAVAPYGVPADARRTDDPRALAAAYRYGLQGLVDRFGLETVREQYDDSLDQSEIFGSRKMKIVFNELLIQENGVPSRLFGLEVSRMRQQTQFYDFYLDDWIDMDEVYSVENDFHGLFFSGGLFLLILIGGTLLYIGLQALFVLIRDPKTVFRPEWVGFAGAFCFVLVTSVFTSALLRQTNGLVYVAAVLAGLRHLTLSRSADKAGR